MREGERDGEGGTRYIERKREGVRERGGEIERGTDKSEERKRGNSTVSLFVV